MRHKATSRRENRRIDIKKERASVRQAIDGGNPRQAKKMNWGSKNDPVPLMDEAGRRPSGRPRKGCSKRKGGKHVPVRTYYTRGSGDYASTYSRVVCKFCGKHRWGRSGDWEEFPEVQPYRANDHWAYHNIVARLGNGLCDCPTCNQKLDAETRPC